jgi:anti-sigma B factor antagonist
MIPQPFNRPVPPAGTCLVVRVSGEVDLATSPRLADLLEQVPHVFDALVIDLDEVDFMDCSALPALLRAAGRFGQGLSLCGAKPPVIRLLQATGLSGDFTLCHVGSPGSVPAGVTAKEGHGLEVRSGPSVELDLGAAGPRSDQPFRGIPEPHPGAADLVRPLTARARRAPVPATGSPSASRPTDPVWEVGLPEVRGLMDQATGLIGTDGLAPHVGPGPSSDDDVVAAVLRPSGWSGSGPMVRQRTRPHDPRVAGPRAAKPWPEPGSGGDLGR